MAESDSADNKAHEEAKGKSNYREVIGTALFEVPWFLMDAFWFWPISHIAALWAGAFGVAVAIFRHIPSLRIVLSLIVLIGLSAYIVQPSLPPTPKPETETHGWLMPADDPTPDNACTSDPNTPRDALVVMLGDMTTYLENLDKRLTRFRSFESLNAISSLLLRVVTACDSMWTSSLPKVSWPLGFETTNFIL